LQSRYYNPEWQRFLNADGVFESGHELLGNNLYVYCYNNPINLYDPDGWLPVIPLAEVAKWIAIIGGIYIAGETLSQADLSSMSNLKLPSFNISMPKFTNPLTVTVPIKPVSSQYTVHADYFSRFDSMTVSPGTAISSNSYTNSVVSAKKYPQPPSNLKVGDRIKTPGSHPGEFTKNNNSPGYTHKKTGWGATNAKHKHGGVHWDMQPPRGSGHINVGPEGNIFGGSMK